jgi:hypothetical protein
VKNVLMKFAGFFVEKVPIEEPHAAAAPPAAGGYPGAAPLQQQLPPHPGFPQVQQQPAGAPEHGFAAGAHQQQPAAPDLLLGHWNAPPAQAAAPAQPRQAPLAIALRAWVPQEYAAYLTPFALHVIAAGGELTVEQARAYGAQALVVSSECLGNQTQLLVSPQLPTVFIAPQPVSVPQRAGLVQVQEPLRASELASAVREAVASWGGAVG